MSHADKIINICQYDNSFSFNPLSVYALVSYTSCKTETLGSSQEFLPSSPSLETRNIFATFCSKHISDFESGGGTADHLTGSPLTNWCIRETMACSDFFSDLCFLTYKSLERLCAMGSLYTPRLFWIRHLALFWDLKIYSMIETDILWYDLRE